VGVSTFEYCVQWMRADQNRHDNSLSDSELIALSAYGAAAITRTCSRLAFEKKGRALQALDLSIEVPTAFKMLFEDKAAQKL
jgi:ATP-dependent NAD(P)H-hydrate dehydratase